MNTVTMPGFAAETSLCRSGTHYQVGPVLLGLIIRQEGQIVPSASPLAARALSAGQLAQSSRIWCGPFGDGYCCFGRYSSCCSVGAALTCCGPWGCIDIPTSTG